MIIRFKSRAKSLFRYNCLQMILKVIISKSFSDRQVSMSPKISSIIKNVERSYDKMFKLLKDIDEMSLSSGKS